MKINLDNLLIDNGRGKVSETSNSYDDFRKVRTGRGVQ